MIQTQLKSPHIIEATYRIVTPMFIGDADQQATGISPQSVKGALRFWWRALNWGRIRSQEKFKTDELALSELHRQEAFLFGSSMDEKKERSGQSCFLLSVSHSDKLNITVKDSIHQAFSKCNFARYLAYGLMEPFRNNKKNRDAAELDRDCINENQLFTVKLVFHSEPDSSLIDALKTIGLLGGLGSRSRHGMGSIALEKIAYKKADVDTAEIYHAPSNLNEYQAAVNALFSASQLELVTSLPPFTAFSSASRVEILVRGSTAYQTLDNFAEKMLVYRSWGRGGNLNGGLKSDKNFEDDHDWYREKNPELPEDFHPRRVVFGLPHNYDRETHHVIPEPEVGSSGEGRRASPLLFHVHKIHDSSYVGVAIYLPATFLPTNKRIMANLRSVPQKIDWEVITNFLDGKGGKKYFPNKTIILSGSTV